GARVGPGCAVGRGAEIASGARVAGSVVWPGARCGDAEGCVVPDVGPVVGAGAR
ncbi:MAG: NDP-sugar synthase, partial [Candidatus Dadabacteria bacterium]